MSSVGGMNILLRRADYGIRGRVVVSVDVHTVLSWQLLCRSR